MPEPAEGAPLPLLPPLALAAGLASVAGAGALANCSLLGALLKSSTTGLFSILLQLAVADIALGASISTEIWTYNLKNWTLGSFSCVAYRGLNIFASTASAYLITTIALHTLATANLEEKSLERRLRRNRDEDEEIRSSRHSLVASSDSSTPPRTMNVDYRVSSSRVPVTQPTIFVWLLALSLSVPDFALATTVQMDHDNIVCTIVDSSQRMHLYSILALFNLFLPAMIMCTVGALLIVKLKSKILPQIEGCESMSALKLSLWLIIVYFVLCVPRSVLTTYNVYSTSLRGNGSTLIESIHHGDPASSIGLVLSCVYLSSLLVRPLLCIILLPSVRKAFSYSHRDTDCV